MVSGFSAEQRQALLKFATSCSRGPLGGFKHLVPPLCIHKVRPPAGSRIAAHATLPHVWNCICWFDGTSF